MAWKNPCLVLYSLFHIVLLKFRRGAFAKKYFGPDHFNDLANEKTLEFAFNDPKYSDRLMKIEILDRPHEGEEILDDEYESKGIHISSPVLASKSKFFLKLFSNGMKESHPNCPVTIRIYASEEDAFMEILHFMYGRKLSSTVMKNSSRLFDVMMLADKFEIVSCIKQCVRLLVNLPMTRESALLYFDIPMRSEYQPLIDQATRFLASYYKDLTKHHDDLKDMPATVIKAILCSDELQVHSEDCVYDIVLKWAKKQFPRLEDRRVVLRSCITSLVRFPYLTCAKLREALTCEYLDRDFAQDVVTEALFFKADPQRCDPMLDALPVESFVQRACMKRIVFYVIYRVTCVLLQARQTRSTREFYLGKHQFCLQFVCDDQYEYFGMYLYLCGKYLGPIAVDCVFAAKKQPEMDFVNLHSMRHNFERKEGRGIKKFFSMPWNSFIGHNNPYFINDVIHLRAEISVIEQ